MLSANRTDTAFPLELVVDDVIVGGLAGLSPTVALRLVSAATPPFYLDWADATFKQSGWTLKHAPLTDIENGVYQRLLNVAGLSPAVARGTHLSAEYTLVGSVSGREAELIRVDDVEEQVTFLRKVAKNRLEEASGNPGTLVLYADDGVTVDTTWTLRDETGGAVLPGTGTPARRSAGTP
jgi:hypothetical protein